MSENGAAAPPPPGEPARWVTTYQVYDADERLISERVTDVRETPVPKAPEAPYPGLYL